MYHIFALRGNKIFKNMDDLFNLDTLKQIEILNSIVLDAKNNNKENLENKEKQEKKDQEFQYITDLLNTIDTQNKEEQTILFNPKDALIKSINNRGRIDIEYISSISNLSKIEVLSKLKNYLYQNPETFNNDPFLGWETKEEYLNGNLTLKYKIAEEANKYYNGLFDKNIELIKKKINELGIVKSKDIFVSLSSSWLPLTVFKEFFKYLVKEMNPGYPDILTLERDEYLKKYRAGLNSHGTVEARLNIALNKKYLNSSDMEFLEFFEKCLEGKTPEIYDTFKVDDKTKKVKNVQKTNYLIEKQEELNNLFVSWVTSNRKILKIIEKEYNETFCMNYFREYDGSILELEDLSADVTLKDFQKDAVLRMLLSKNVLLAHEVGSGKTYEMIAAAHELYRIGLSKKNLIVVPNNILSQWENLYYKLYPNAKILVINPQKFNKDKVKSFELIKKGINERNEEVESIIIAHSTFDMIDNDYDGTIKELEEELEILNNGKDIKGIKARITYLTKRIENLKKANEELKDFNFRDLEIDRLFVDEAHYYKNLGLGGEASYISGFSQNGSEKTEKFYKKVRVTQAREKGGVVLATGTPITNSIAEIFVMQKYLQNGLLKMLNIDTFEKWIATYSKKEASFEIDVDTNKSRIVQRYVHFNNLRELSMNLSQVATFNNTKLNEDFLPKYDGPTTLKLPQTNDLKDYLLDISNRVDLIRNRSPRVFDRGTDNEVVDNMLLVTTDGKKAALDLRLVDWKEKEINKESKVRVCAKQIYEKYLSSARFLGTQVVFCDSSTPKITFNLYSELKKILVMKGIPEEEIAFIHDYKSDKERNKLFKDVNSGKIRIIIGSTFKLGIGVNMQERLCALHHLDIPWRPADMIQREGRIYRAGNTCESIDIYRYVTENSFDAYSWQILERKQKFIDSLLSGHLKNRSASDISETALSYGEAKSLAIGNPLLKEAVDLENNMNRYISLSANFDSEKTKNTNIYNSLSEELPVLREELDNIKEDLDHNNTLVIDYYKFFSFELAKDILEKIDLAVTNQKDEEYKLNNDYKLLLPKYQPIEEEEKYLILQRKGTYKILLGKGARGLSMRLANFFISFNSYYEAKKIEYENKSILHDEIGKNLNNQNPYTDIIERLTKERDKLMDKLKKGGIINVK